MYLLKEFLLKFLVRLTLKFYKLYYCNHSFHLVLLFLFLLHGGASFLMVSIIPNFCGHCKACGTSLQISAVGRVGLAFFLKGVYDMIRFITFSFSVRGG